MNNDYIKRQDAIDTHCAICPDKDKCPDGDFVCPDRELFRMIKPADAVPVIRCKECGKQPVCRFSQYQGDDGFCSYAERGTD